MEYTNDQLSAVVFVGVVIFFALGWVMNFQNLLQYTWPSNRLIVSIVGVFFAPLGGITGWFW